MVLSTVVEIYDFSLENSRCGPQAKGKLHFSGKHVSFSCSGHALHQNLLRKLRIRRTGSRFGLNRRGYSTAMDSFLMVAVVLWRCFLVWQFGFRLFHYLGKGIRKDNTSGAPWYQEHERGKHEKQLHVIDLYKLSRRILWKPFWEFWYTWTLERPDP